MKNFVDRPTARWLAVAAWAGLIFWLSSRSVLPSPGIPHVDKLEHAGFYAVLAVLLARALQTSRRFRRGPPVVRGGLVVIACLLYGVNDEMHQAFVPGRSCETGDAAADAAGALAAAGYLFRVPLKPSKIRPWL